MPTTLSTEHVLAALTRVVAPYLGDTMARSAVQAHFDKLGVTGNGMTLGHVEALIARLGSGLNVFLGREKSAQVVGELKTAVSGGQENGR